MHTKEEQEIVKYIETSNPKSIKNITDEIKKIKSAVTTKYTKRVDKNRSHK